MDSTTAVPDYMKGLQNILASGLPSGVTSVPGSSSTSVPATFQASSSMSTTHRLKFMLVSTHCHQYTGYSKVSYGILRQLAKVQWLDVVHFGFQKFPQQQFADGYRPYPQKINVIDAASIEKPFEQGFGFKQLPDMIRKEKPDVIMIYNDMSVVGKFLMEIEKSGIPRTFKTWVYCDQVYTTQLQGYLDMLNLKAERIFAFTPFWRQCLRDQGITRPVDVLLHGFEADVYKPLPRNEIRKTMKIPEDAFVFLNVNRNQPRKRYDLLIMAFVELIVKYPTKPLFLMCICDKGEKGGWWLFEIYQRELKLRGVNPEQYAGRLMVSSQDMVFKDEDINVFYNVANVGVNAAEGEGWGLCNFEQMGVGVPQIVPNIGGFKEFCNEDNSVLVEAKHRFYLPMVYSPVGGEVFAVDPHDLCMGMEEYVMSSEKLKAHGEAARKTVLGYTWERAVEPLIRRLRQEKEDLDAES
jgi:glycosyltransferase involved in cell wall biosynthesis